MARLQITIKDESFELAGILGLVYAIEHWDEFAKEMGFDKGPDGEKGVEEMHDELCHHVAHQLYDNDIILSVLFQMWGEEKVSAFVDKLTDHKHE